MSREVLVAPDVRREIDETDVRAIPIDLTRAWRRHDGVSGPRAASKQHGKAIISRVVFNDPRFDDGAKRDGDCAGHSATKPNNADLRLRSRERDIHVADRDRRDVASTRVDDLHIAVDGGVPGSGV